MSEHIDIQTDKLIDWCVNRGQLPADWLASLKSVQNKVKNALVNPAYAIPVDIQRIMEEQGMNYWALINAFDTLSAQLLTSRGHASTETSKLKNFFGSYTDASLKALAALLALYRKNNLFLAEGARILMQNVNYDIPQLKKLIGTNSKQTEDLLRKSAEELKSARDLQTKSTNHLREHWGIAFVGNDLANQIKKRAEEDVPELINAVITAAKEPKFAEAIDYYTEFVKFSMQDPAAPSSSASFTAPFPTLVAVRKSELLKVPEKGSADSAASASSSSAVEESSGGIDWGISVEGSGDTSTGGTIDWGITSEGGGEGASAGTIDWGDDSATTSNAASINWDIETTESGDASAPSASPSLSTSNSSTSASSTSTSLENDSFRHSFLTELLELESFLQERVAELSGSGNDDLASAAFQGSGVSHLLTLQSASSSQSYLTVIRSILQTLRSPRLTQLLLIRSSKRYLDRVVQGIKQQFASVKRLENSASQHQNRRSELQRITTKSAHELDVFVKQTREIKKALEQDISKLFQNRPVHVVGEINNLLQ